MTGHVTAAEVEAARPVAEAMIAELAQRCGISERAAAKQLAGVLCERIIADVIRPGHGLVRAEVWFIAGDKLHTIRGLPRPRPRPPPRRNSDETIPVSVCPIDWSVERRRDDHGAERVTLVLDRDAVAAVAEICNTALAETKPRPKLFEGLR